MLHCYLDANRRYHKSLLCQFLFCSYFSPFSMWFEMSIRKLGLTQKHLLFSLWFELKFTQQLSPILLTHLTNKDKFWMGNFFSFFSPFELFFHNSCKTFIKLGLKMINSCFIFKFIHQFESVTTLLFCFFMRFNIGWSCVK